MAKQKENETPKFRLLAIHNVDVVPKIWGFIADDLDEVLEYTHKDTDPAIVFQRIMNGELLLWMGYFGKDYIGFCTTRFHDTPQTLKFLDINHVFIKRGAPRDTLMDGIQKLEIFARKYGCDAMRMWSTRGFQRILEPHGWKPEYVEFIKQLKKEEC